MSLEFEEGFFVCTHAPCSSCFILFELFTDCSHLYMFVCNLFDLIDFIKLFFLWVYTSFFSGLILLIESFFYDCTHLVQIAWFCYWNSINLAWVSLSLISSYLVIEQRLVEPLCLYAPCLSCLILFKLSCNIALFSGLTERALMSVTLAEISSANSSK